MSDNVVSFTLSDALAMAERRLRGGQHPVEAIDWAFGLNLNGQRDSLIEFIESWGRQSDLPDICTSGQHLRECTRLALEAMANANNPPVVFVRGAVPVRICRDERRLPFIDPLSESAFRGRMARVANFVRQDKGGHMLAVPPPLDVVRDAMALKEWPFPPLENITETPVMRPDGTIFERPGYDYDTGLVYIPASNARLPEIPDSPTPDDVKAATDAVLELVDDFPFDGDASHANMVATLMAPVLHRLIDGLLPASIIDKPQPGTGATYLARLVSILATGRDAACLTAPSTDEEWEKVITTLIRNGQTLMVADNIQKQLRSAPLAKLLSAPRWLGRILGRTETIEMPNRMMVVGTGNNISLDTDLTRRCVGIRLDAKTAQPWLRDTSQFRHPDIIGWAMANRMKILAAILTIGRAWCNAGKPEDADAPILGGYERYSRVLGGVLAFMGVDGFMSNLQAMYAAMDETIPAWMSFLEAWQAELEPDAAYTSRDLVAKLEGNAALKAALPDWLADMNVKNYQRRLGMALRGIRDVEFPNGLRVTKAGEVKHTARWRVVGCGDGHTHPKQGLLGTDGEYGEYDSIPMHGEKQTVYGCEVESDSPNPPVGVDVVSMTSGHLPECPRCHQDGDKWDYDAEGRLVCECGHTEVTR